MESVDKEEQGNCLIKKTQSIYNSTIAEENFQELIPVAVKDYLGLSVSHMHVHVDAIQS